MLTLLEIISLSWVAAGKTGRPTREFVARWRAENPAYGNAPLHTRFRSGSTIALRGPTKLDRATKAWLASGRPSPAAPEFSNEEFNAHLDRYEDDYTALEPGPKK